MQVSKKMEATVLPSYTTSELQQQQVLHHPKSPPHIGKHTLVTNSFLN